jgi:hypothetical protein
MLFDTTAADPRSIELTPEICDRVKQAADDEPLVRLRPFVDGEGLDTAAAFLRGLHRQPAGPLSDGGAPVYAFEIWFDGGTFRFHLRASDPSDAVAVVTGQYPNCETTVQPPVRFPSLSGGEYAATANLRLRHDAAFPVKHPASDPPLADDPYRTLLSRMEGTDDERVVVQVVFMPVRSGWTRRGLIGRLTGGDVERVAASRREGQVRGYVAPEVVQSKRDSKAADDIAAQIGRPAFSVAIRAVAVAPAASTVKHRLSRVADAFQRYTHDTTDQRFDAAYATAGHAPAVLEAAAMRALTPDSTLRRLLRGRANVLTVNELAGLVHVPGEGVENAAVDWTRRGAGGGIPADSPRDPPAADRPHMRRRLVSQPRQGAVDSESRADGLEPHGSRDVQSPEVDSDGV